MKQSFYTTNGIPQSKVVLENGNSYRVMRNFEGATIIARLDENDTSGVVLHDYDSEDAEQILDALESGALELVGDKLADY